MKSPESSCGIFNDELQFDLDDKLSSPKLTIMRSSPNNFMPTNIVAAKALSGRIDDQFPSLISSTPLAIANRRDNRKSISSSLDEAFGFPNPNIRIARSHGNIDKRLALYKTEICRTFEETGTCKYGDRCQFAHSQTELRPTSRHPRYKTEVCKTFWEKGSCPYGQRCCFIHNESHSGVPTLSKSMSFSSSCILNDNWSHSGIQIAPHDSGRQESKILSRLKSVSSSPMAQVSISNQCARVTSRCNK